MSQFEREIKNVLENYEMPMDNGAWSSMEQKMNAGNSSSIYKQFVVAGVVLTAAFGFLTSDLGSGHSAQDALLADNHNIESTNFDYQNDNHEASISTAIIDENGHVTAESAITNEISPTTASEVLAKNVKKAPADSKHTVIDNLSIEEKKSLIKINEKINEQSDNNMVTEYFGKNFNLNANVILIRNGENGQGVFLPEAIKEGDDFIMEIFDHKEEMIFSTSDVNNPWKGHNQVTEKLSDAGNYQWKVTLDKDNRKEIFTGVIMVK